VLRLAMPDCSRFRCPDCYFHQRNDRSLGVPPLPLTVAVKVTTLLPGAGFCDEASAVAVATAGRNSAVIEREDLRRRKRDAVNAYPLYVLPYDGVPVPSSRSRSVHLASPPGHPCRLRKSKVPATSAPST